jgi:hypothetical protein
VIFSNSLYGNTINIPTDYTTIQEGINAAQVGDTVLVDEGVYNENINFRGKNITVTSRFIIDRDVSFILNTIIDGSTSTVTDTGSCAVLVMGEDSTAVLQGFTLTHGTGTSFDFGGGNLYREGGGIILNNSSATIRNNLIIENEAAVVPGVGGGGGGGISSMTGDPRILNNVIMLNTASYAAGIVLNWSGGIIRNNVVYRNYGAAQFGTGGIMVWESPPGTGIIENNTIVGNSSSTTAGGLSVTNTSALIRNNIIWGNRQQSGTQVTGYQSSTVEYCNTEENYSGQGNINIYPAFLSSNFLLDALSPCIDSGSPETSYNDKEDPQNLGFALYPSLGGLRNDIGAYGGYGAEIFPGFSHEHIHKPDQVSFSTVVVNDSSTQSIKILNLSTEDLTIDSTAITNENSDLTLSKNIVSGVYQPVRGDTIEIAWKPIQAGSLNDTLKIYHGLTEVPNPAIVIITGTAEDPTGITDDIQPDRIPSVFESHQNFPNPFNPVTTIRYSLGENTQVSLKIYNVHGQLIRTLVSGEQTEGLKSVIWDGKNDLGQSVASGIYIYRLEAGSLLQSRKMLLTR